MHRQNKVAAGDNQENHIGQCYASTSSTPATVQPNEPQVYNTRTAETMAPQKLEERSKGKHIFQTITIVDSSPKNEILLFTCVEIL